MPSDEKPDQDRAMDVPLKEMLRGAWIFVSHSHRDLERVRAIRNELERLGHNPLLFYLKALEDDDTSLPDLLKREIEARNFFLLCDSVFSRASKWVQEERRIIAALTGKIYRKIDLSQPWEVQLPQVMGLAQAATVYITYSNDETNWRMARAIARALEDADFAVMLQSHQGSARDRQKEYEASLINSGVWMPLLSMADTPVRLAAQARLAIKLQRLLQFPLEVRPVIIAPGIPAHIFAWSNLGIGSSDFHPAFNLSSGPLNERLNALVREVLRSSP